MNIREQILTAALRVYGECGYRGATTRRIAEAAGVNEVTLFRHFGSKAQLIHEAVHSALPEPSGPGLPETPSDPDRELRGWCRSHLEHLWSCRSFIRTGMGECEQHAEIGSYAGEGPRRVGLELRHYLERVRALGWCSADCDVGAATRLLMGALFSDALGRDIMPDMFPEALPEAADKYVTLFLRAIGLQGRAAGLNETTGTNDGNGRKSRQRSARSANGHGGTADHGGAGARGVAGAGTGAGADDGDVAHGGDR